MGTAGSGVQPARTVTSKPQTTASSALFEASLRNFCRPNDDRRKAWNPSCRIAYKSKVIEPHGSRETFQLIQPFETAKCASKAKPFTPVQIKSFPPICAQSVKVSARYQSGNDNTNQAMDNLKCLVDNFVRKLFSGAGNFDESALEELRMTFSRIQQNSTTAQDEGQNGSNVVQNGSCGSQQTLYQTVLWCIIFQACIDVLSKPSETCSVDHLLNRSWKYLENMRSILQPYISIEEEKHTVLHSKVNVNQSNRADFFEGSDGFSSHLTEQSQSWDSYTSTRSPRTTSYRNKGIQTLTPQMIPPSTGSLRHSCQEPEPEGLRRKYESSKRELAVEADREARVTNDYGIAEAIMQKTRFKTQN
ncbi:unnamed protein product [Dibothriocephalus latus]|uniref:Uncharacterized protein n=1 Tax=Dibothriocephalus latus TaxID=60516 RepID=A0A3P7M5R7_DIBLA|nr:unnamed protein product [Dibothriocephalus latus]